MFHTEELKFPLLNLVRLPDIKIDKKFKKEAGLNEKNSNFEFLKAISNAALEKKLETIPVDKRGVYKDRLNFELDLVDKLSFTDYFLLVWKVINKMKELGAFCDFGRGSAASSLVFYSLGITGVDPIKKNLLFARFISEVRAKKKVIDGVTYLQGDLAPDVDLNLGGARAKIIEWLNKEYEGRVCKIAAVGTLSGKILIKDVYKAVEDATEEDACKVANLVDKHFGIVEDIGKMPEKSKEFKEWSENHPKSYKIALKLRDLVRQKSSHASGYFISFDKLDENYPLELSKDKELLLAYDMNTAAKLGIKLDCLGLTTNEIIQEVLSNIPETVENMAAKLENDPLIYDQYQNGTLLPYGLYQISADCAYKALLKIKPKNLDELSDLNAIARPGALAYLDGYVKSETPCPHLAFTQILGPTRNYCLYQEQMIQMAVALGFTPEEGEVLRRIVGKKKVDEVKLWKTKIYEKCELNKFGTEIGDLFLKILDDSSKYSFNASHAWSTASLSALTTYLKYKYPLQFYTACLNNIHNFPKPQDELSQIVKELPYFNIKIRPPNILNNNQKFHYTDKNEIFMPVSCIKGVSKKAIDKLNKFKITNPNKIHIFKAADEAGVPRNIFSSLVLVGSLDSFLDGATRSKLLLEFSLWKELKDKEKEWAEEHFEAGGRNLFDTIKYLNEKAKDLADKPLIKDSRRETLKKHVMPYWKMFKQNESNIDIAYYFFEKELLGFAYSNTLINIYKSKVPDLLDIQAVNECGEKEYVRIIGSVDKVKKGTSKKGTPYFKIDISDEKGSITAMMFTTRQKDTIADCENINGRLPQEKDIIVCSGQKMGDAIFLDSCGIQDISVWIKVSQIDS